MVFRSVWILLFAIGLGCGASKTETRSDTDTRRAPLATPDSRPSAPSEQHLIILGTNDIHGHIDRLALLSGYKRCVEKQHPDALVLLLDGGDLFQGTLESNLNEGASVVEMLNAIGLTAAAVGNHEFDFGPVGEDATPTSDKQDPRGALKERMAQAEFRFLSANLLDAATNRRPPWQNLSSSLLLEREGLRIGIVGLSTEETLQTTISANVQGLAIEDPLQALAREAKALRARGANVVLGVGHLGGKCESFDDPRNLSSCVEDEELFRLLHALPQGTIDGFVGGHTHRRVAHIVHGVAAIESGARMSHLGRVDVIVRKGVVREATPQPPEATCSMGEACDYRGCDVRAHVSPAVQGIADRYIQQAKDKRRAPLGVTVQGVFQQLQDRESPLGNLLADLILETHPKADLAIMNGGGIRAPIRDGEMTYGDFFEVFPFDNRFAKVEMTGKEIRQLFFDALKSGHHSVLSIAGMRVQATCKKGEPQVEVYTRQGTKIRPGQKYQVITSDFLATGGDGAFKNARVQIEPGPLMRDALVDVLKQKYRVLKADAPNLNKPRYPKRDAFTSCAP